MKTNTSFALLSVAFAIFSAASSAQVEVDPVSGAPIPLVEITLSAKNPLNDKPVNLDRLYPILGTPGDGQPDKFFYSLEIVGVDSDFNLDPENAGIFFSIAPRDEDMEPTIFFPNRTESRPGVWGFTGDFDLPFDIIQGQVLQYKGRAKFPGGAVGFFDEEITMGNPVLSFSSTIKSTTTESPNGGTLTITSTVQGTIPLAMLSMYPLQYGGAGELRYETFTIEEPTGRCNVITTTTDGSFRALEISFPEEWTAADSVMGLPPPSEVLFFADPNIAESAIFTCESSPIAFPLPMLIHWFAAFYSFHGGEMGYESEMTDAGDAISITDWEHGEGDVAGVRIYNRTDRNQGGKIYENTRLELKWPE